MNIIKLILEKFLDAVLNISDAVKPLNLLSMKPKELILDFKNNKCNNKNLNNKPKKFLPELIFDIY